MRRLSLLTVAALLLVSVDGWAQSCDGCGIGYRHPAGLTGLTSSGTAITSTLPIQIPNGAAAEYGELAWSSNMFLLRTVANGGTSRALALLSANNSVDVVDGTLTARINFSTATNTGLRIDKDRPLGWVNGAANANVPDTLMMRDAAAVIQLGFDAATATAQTVKGSDSTGATIAGGSLTLKGGAGTSGIANGGALILAGGANSSTGEPGAVAIADGGTKPTCAAGIRGSIWYDAGGAGVADTIEVCAKQAAGDSYAWRAMATIP